MTQAILPAAAGPQRIDLSVADTFGISAPASLNVPGYAAPGPYTPVAASDYRFQPALLTDVLAWHKGIVSGQHHDGLWLTGPMGSGKSSLITQVAAWLNQPLIEVNGHRRLEFDSLVGHLTAIGGDVLFQDGPLATAMRSGAWLLLNEVDLIDPGELAGLNTLLDGRPLVINANGAEAVPPARGFGLICTANTAGGGDATGLYVGTQRMNAALLDRFWIVAVDYPAPDQEMAVVHMAVPKLPSGIIKKMIEVANEVRRLFVGEGGAGGSIDLTLSTRTLVRWAHLTLVHKHVPDAIAYALERALLNRTDTETATAVRGIVQRVFGQGLSTGNPQPPGSSHGA